jgi:hypothetical protein
MFELFIEYFDYFVCTLILTVITFVIGMAIWSYYKMFKIMLKEFDK